MKTFLYYFDKWTEWLDFSWLIMRPPKEKKREQAHYYVEPAHYEVEPLLDSYHK
jgi:hypothetical protein